MDGFFDINKFFGHGVKKADDEENPSKNSIFFNGLIQKYKKMKPTFPPS
jgi:hypothetical protein